LRCGGADRTCDKLQFETQRRTHRAPLGVALRQRTGVVRDRLVGFPHETDLNLTHEWQGRGRLRSFAGFFVRSGYFGISDSCGCPRCFVALS
jgi:hypothetical protein